MKIIKLIKSNNTKIIKTTIEVLKAGGLVVFPSDTVYGLLCDAINPKAVAKLLAFKERSSGKAISVFMADKKMADKYVILNQNAINIINNLLPGPFTVVCQSRHQTDRRLEAENGTLGFRIPDFPLINQLLTVYGLPLTATSANISSTPPHYSIESLLNSTRSLLAGVQGDSLIKKKKICLVDLIIDAGKLPYNKPSTVIDTTSGELRTLRFGDLLPATPNSLISKSEKQTRDLARFILSKTINKSPGKPLVFLLNGELGTGKTIFTKGLGKALGIKDTIVSPTYNICNEYAIAVSMSSQTPTISTQIPQLSTDKPIKYCRYCDIERQDHRLPLLVHYDLYRIETPEDLKEIKFLESFRPSTIYSIEWPERIDENSLSKLKKISLVIYVKINHLSKNQREIFWSN